MIETNERLYALIPAVYRLRDAERGYPLRALAGVIDQQLAALEADIGQLYENWFIETCQEWVVPYIADLLGARAVNPVAARTASPRAYVANVLSYRRRKGTAAMLEQLAQDLTGWPARAVELFQSLATTQHLNHVRPGLRRALDLHDDGSLALVGGPFETAAHTIEVRGIASGRGRYDIQNVGLFLWRLDAVPLVRAEASAASELPAEPGLFRMSPLGDDRPLFNRRRVVEDVERLALEEDVPGPVRRRALLDDLAEFRDARARLGDRAPDRSRYFGVQPVLALNVAGADLPVEALRICDLADWHRPADVAPVAGGWPADAVAIDPVLGRIAFARSLAPASPPLVSHYHGFSGPLGGGGYSRPPALPASAPPVTGGGTALADRLADPALAYTGVTAGEQARRVAVLRAIGGRTPARTPAADRLTDLLALAGKSCIVEIGDSRRYTLASVTVPAASVLEIRAADGERPVVTLSAPATFHLGAGAVLILDGLAVTGATISVADAPGAGVLLQHCTLVPGLALGPDGAPLQPAAPSLVGPAASARFDLLLHRSISGPLRLGGPPAGDGQLFIEDSIVDDAGGGLPAVAAARAALARTTIFGETAVEVLDLASDVIFDGPVRSLRTQEGCVRFSFVPDGSRVCQPYRCQPALALQGWAAMPPATRPDRDVVLSRVVPTFTSTRYGAPGYAQLTAGAAPEIRRGGSDEGEMGAFNFLQASQREDNLRASLDEYLRFGLEAGIFYFT